MSEQHTNELNCIYYYYLMYMAYILDAVIARGCMRNISKSFIHLVSFRSVGKMFRLVTTTEMKVIL